MDRIKTKMNRKYKIDIDYFDGRQKTIEIETPDIKWTMEQYQRNRLPFIYNIIT